MKAASDGAIPGRWRTASVLLVLILGGCGDDPAAPGPSCDQASRLPFGQTLVHSLDSQAEVLDGAPADYFSVELETAGTLTVDMSSSGVDPFLVLWRADHPVPVAQAFDPTGTGAVRTARLELDAGSGCYLLAATAWESVAEGEYTIRADLAAAP